jgi:hypothetical protein
MEFEALRDLVKIITRNKVKQIEVLGNPGQDEVRTEQLYDGISKGKFHSDEEAAKYFFDADDAKDPNYKKLRNRLIRQLINTAFFVDVNQPMFNERSKAQYNCYRDFAAAYVLSLREAISASVYMMHQVLEQSIKFEFTDLTAEICRFLRMKYARSLADPKKHEEFTLKHREYETKRRLELTALDYYEELITYYIVKRSPNTEIHAIATQYYDELMPLSEKVDTSQFYHHTFQIGIIKYLSSNDSKSALDLSRQALNVLNNRKNINRSAMLTTALQKLASLTQLHIFDNDEGDETANYCLSLTNPGEFNWFRTLEVYFYYCIYRKNYKEALEVYTKAMTQHERLDILGSALRDNWQLYGGYLHLLAALGQLDPKEVESAVGPFRYAKFINEFEVLDKDKEGMNIPLVLLPILFSLAKGVTEEEEFGRSVEAFEIYRKRYLDNEMNRRSASFMNMLMALPKKAFDEAAAERKIKKEMAVLESIPPQVAGQNFAVEIVPYEDLWEMVMTKM